MKLLRESFIQQKRLEGMQITVAMNEFSKVAQKYGDEVVSGMGIAVDLDI